MSNYNLEKIRSIIYKNFNRAECGIFFSRNTVGDVMTTIYEKDGVTIDICREWGYFEIFGLKNEDKNELIKYYYDLKDKKD